MYIGEHSHGLYALPSLVDSSIPTISSKAGQLLLDGPTISQLRKENTPPQPSPPFDGISKKAQNDCQKINNEKNNIMALGKY